VGETFGRRIHAGGAHRHRHPRGVRGLELSGETQSRAGILSKLTYLETCCWILEPKVKT
jgi:hypothetical protein